MRVLQHVHPRGPLAAALVALVLLSIPPRSVIRGAAQADADAPHRVKTAATALPPIDAGERQLPADAHDRLLRDRAQPQVAIEGVQPLPGRVIVKFRSGSSTASHAAAASSVGGHVAGRRLSARFDVMEIDTGANPESIASTLSARADVEYAQADYRIYPRLHPNDPLYTHQWNYPLINMEGAWDKSDGADSSIIVAVLDTGVAFEPATFDLTAPAWRSGGQRIRRSAR
jgi:hypothetical protein